MKNSVPMRLVCTTFLLCFLVALASSAQSGSNRVIHLPLEKRLPKPLARGTSRGFPHKLRIHEPLPAPRSKLRALVRHIQRSLTLDDSARESYDVELFGGMVAVGEYYAKVHIGGQMLRVQIDTGSATLAAPLKQCTHCKRGDMRYSVEESSSGIAEYISCDHGECGANTCSFDCGKCSETKACCAKANDTNCAFHLNFGDGSGAKGMLVRDQFKWGDAEFPVTFGGIASDSDDFERSQVDGILGMAYAPLACNPSCVTPTFDAMRKTYPSLKDYFTICITEDAGRLILGDYDTSLSTKSASAINWVPLELSTPPTFYSFPVTGNFQMDGKEIELPSFSRAIVDSGTTLIVVSKATFTVIKRHFLSDYCDVPGLCDTDTWFQAAHCTKLSDEDLMKLPTLTIPLDGFDLKMGPKDYMINYASKGPEFWCVGIMSLDSMSGGVNVILGNVVMNKYVTIYDREQKRVGFVESDTKCGAHSGSDESGGDSGGDEGTSGYGGVTDGENEEAAAKCATANNCSDCADVDGVQCKWVSKEGKCVPGLAPLWMCTFVGFESNLVYIIGTAVGAVVAAIVLVAVLVQSYRKRRDSEELDTQEDEGQEQEPLAPDEEAASHSMRDTRGAFTVGDEEA